MLFQAGVTWRFRNRRPVSLYSHNAPRCDGSERNRRRGYQWDQIAQPICCAAEYQDAQLSATQVLLIWNIAIHRDEHRTPPPPLHATDRRFSVRPVWRNAPSGNCGRETRISTAHRRTGPSESSRSRREQQLLGFGKYFQGHSAGHGWKTFQKVLEGFAALQVFKERLNGDPCSLENRRAVHYFWIARHCFHHDFIVPQRELPRRIRTTEVLGVMRLGRQVVLEAHRWIVVENPPAAFAEHQAFGVP